VLRRLTCAVLFPADALGSKNNSFLLPAADYGDLFHGTVRLQLAAMGSLLRRAHSVVLQVIVNTSKAVTLILGVYLLKEAANASASAGMCLSVVGAAMYALLP
jgi:hypothetical protein